MNNIELLYSVFLKNKWVDTNNFLLSARDWTYAPCVVDLFLWCYTSALHLCVVWFHIPLGGTYLKHKIGRRKLRMYTCFEIMRSLLSTTEGSVLPVKVLNGSLWPGHPHTSVTWALKETWFTVNLGAVLYCVTPEHLHGPWWTGWINLLLQTSNVPATWPKTQPWQG